MLNSLHWMLLKTSLLMYYRTWSITFNQPSQKITNVQNVRCVLKNPTRKVLKINFSSARNFAKPTVRVEFERCHRNIWTSCIVRLWFWGEFRIFTMYIFYIIPTETNSNLVSDQNQKFFRADRMGLSEWLLFAVWVH